MKKLLFIFGLLVVLSANSQSKIIPLWPGKIPGAIANPEFKHICDSDANWVWERNIINPVLEYYPAPKKIATGVSVVICPGGAYWCLAIRHEGSDIARWFNQIGITAFVLKYRLPSDSIMENKTIAPLQDGQEAIRIVRRHAKEWGIDPGKIGVMGFSAGGHFASTISTHYNEKVYKPIDNTSARPDFSILIYPVISMDSTITHQGSKDNLLGLHPSRELVSHFSNELQVDSLTPPAFLVHSLDDNVVPVENSMRYALSMRNHKRPCELHIYEKGGHGYGLGRSKDTESSWPEALKKWLMMRKF
jgi:acetyl esterase/lipase